MKAMQTNNPNNERVKRRYFSYLREAKRYSDSSLDGVASALHKFEVYTKYRDFRSFHIQQAIAFKKQLAQQDSRRAKGRLSEASRYSTLAALKKFFQWLAGEPGFRSRLRYADAEYFNLSEKEMRVAKATREQPVPTVEQVKYVLASMPRATAIERRNRALIAFTILTGVRDGALASLKLKHVELSKGRVVQDAREVRTKFSKTFVTYFFPVGGDVQEIVADWVGYLQTSLLWGPDDPLFPATRLCVDSNGLFASDGLDRKHWSNASPIRSIFREAFTSSGMPYFPPHRFRKTLIRLGQQRCRTPEEFKAWSQNVGHDNVMTTFMSYGQVPCERQAEIIQGLGSAPAERLETIAKLREGLAAAERILGSS